MNVLLIGNGGREAALAWRLAQSPQLARLLVTGENARWPEKAEVLPANDVSAWVRVARDGGVGLVVVGPEAPLEAGLADALDEIGIPCFGPTRAAARLETSKSFAKEVMRAAGVPTADAIVVDPTTAEGRAAANARAALGAVVIKVDGLAAGKGVFVCPTAAEAQAALDEIGRFGSAAHRILLESLLTGPEVSLFALCDGERATPLVSAQDHKRLLDGDHGPNTGGMGAFVPSPHVDASRAEALCNQIHRPVLAEMRRRGMPFRGLLYAGVMLTPDGPRVLEFNARFGDPETQPMMRLWADDLLAWLHAAAIGALPEGSPKFSAGAACGVVLAAEGYPDAPKLGVILDEPATPDPRAVCFFAGAKRAGPTEVVSAGGRILSCTATGATLGEARASAYAAISAWAAPHTQHRTDIGASAPATTAHVP
jgi:phosphoribosylamine--glycine ligase